MFLTLSVAFQVAPLEWRCGFGGSSRRGAEFGNLRKAVRVSQHINFFEHWFAGSYLFLLYMHREFLSALFSRQYQRPDREADVLRQEQELLEALKHREGGRVVPER